MLDDLIRDVQICVYQFLNEMDLLILCQINHKVQQFVSHDFYVITKWSMNDPTLSANQVYLLLRNKKQFDVNVIKLKLTQTSINQLYWLSNYFQNLELYHWLWNNRLYCEYDLPDKWRQFDNQLLPSRCNKRKGKSLINVTINDLVEAFDNQYWYVSVVRDIRPNELYVHYIGWSVRYDVWLRMDSGKLAPFGTRKYANVNKHLSTLEDIPFKKRKKDQVND